MLVSEKTPNLLIDQLLSYTAPEDIGLDPVSQPTMLVSEKTPNILIGQLTFYTAPEDIGLDLVSQHTMLQFQALKGDDCILED